ncbi:Hypothetical predicted protein [Octopus vulgaris]|uniref:Uncharacterized protein n=1 Tax=Octopus vulgaris TaxID=6645 RepID=A0AA36B5J9_OCTVU|nr:Hypothetical predicted protein [Octopus vulgaris]
MDNRYHVSKAVKKFEQKLNMYKREAMLFVMLMLLLLVNPVKLSVLSSAKCPIPMSECLNDPGCLKEWYHCNCNPTGTLSLNEFCICNQYYSPALRIVLFVNRN